MSTALHETPATHFSTANPWRSILRSSAVLVIALGLTTVVLVALANVVDTWA